MTCLVHSLRTAIASAVICSLATLAHAEPTAISASRDDAATILVAFEDGVVAFDGTGKLRRVYALKGKGTTHLVDVNLDQRPDFVGLSKKEIFVIGADANPVWNADGCAMTRLGNIAGENDLEVFCLDGRDMRVIAADGVLVWELELSGMSFSDCQLVDLRGASMGDIECKLKGGKVWLQISGAGALLEEAAEVASGATPHAIPSAPPNLLAEETLFDFDGDGVAEEYLSTEGGDVMVNSKSSPGKPRAMASIAAAVATSFDLDGDGDVEILLASDERIVALDDDAEDTVRFDTTFARKGVRRTPEVEFGTIGSYGLEAEQEAIDAVVRGASDDLAACYARRVEKDRFLKVGRYSVRAIVAEAGKVTAVEESYSTLDDDKVEGCIDGVVGKLALPGPAADADVSYATVDLVFGYRDQ